MFCFIINKYIYDRYVRKFDVNEVFTKNNVKVDPTIKDCFEHLTHSVIYIVSLFVYNGKYFAKYQGFPITHWNTCKIVNLIGDCVFEVRFSHTVYVSMSVDNYRNLSSA